jgi:NAD(P)-dependent dehydrogenase (short-subunit alcohol dehydrogenase family)
MTWRRAIVCGASGGIGAAVADDLEARGTIVDRLARSTTGFDLENEDSIAEAAREALALGTADLVFVATGALAIDGVGPEKTFRTLQAPAMARQFAVNATGPALVAKHFLPLLPRSGRCAFAVLGARVGSIGDNRLGGWYGHRAAKSALVQIVRTLSIELARSRPEAMCVTLHPGTVATGLSSRFAAADRAKPPAEAARHLLAVLDRLTPADSGGHFAWDGSAIDP